MILSQDIVPSTCQYHAIQGANDNVHGEHPPHHVSLKYIRPRMSEKLYKIFMFQELSLLVDSETTLVDQR